MCRHRELFTLLRRQAVVHPSSRSALPPECLFGVQLGGTPGFHFDAARLNFGFDLSPR